MSQSSELEEGEHPKSEDPSPLIKNEEENNHNHKLYTRGVGALLDGIMQDSENDRSPETPKLRGKEIDTISLNKTPILSFSPVNMSFEPRSDIAPRIISIEKQLATIRSMQPQSSIHKDGKLDEDTLEDDEEMEIEEENSIEVKKDLSLLAVKSVKSLDCPLCTERFQHPRLLPCLHTFCSSCIQKRITEDNAVSCPICLRCVKLTLPTVELLPVNAILDKQVKLVEMGEENNQEKAKNCSTCEEISLFWCMECETNFCEKCKKVHLNIKAVSDHKLIAHDELKENIGISYSKSEYCVHHKEHVMNLYCEPCDAIICRDCTLINHKNHNYGFVKDFTAAKRRKLLEEVERARTKVVPLKQLIDAVEEDIKESEHDEKVKAEIKEATEAAIAQIRAQEKSLLEEITTKAKSRSEQLRGKYKELRYAVDSSQSCLDFISSLFYQGTMKDLVALAPLVSNRVAEITAYRPEIELNRRIPKFKLPNTKTVPCLGRVYGSFDYQNIGEHPHVIGGEGKKERNFKFPTGVAFHPLGYIVVVDRDNTLQIFEKTGAFLEELTQKNTEHISKLKNPNGVAVDKSGYFYVADSSKCRIAVYNPRGVFSHEIGAKGSSLQSPVPGSTPEYPIPVDVASPDPSRKVSKEDYHDYRSRDRDYRGRDSRDYYRDYRDHRDHRDYRDRDYHRDRKRRGYDSHSRRESRDSSEPRPSFDDCKRERGDFSYDSKRARKIPVNVELNGPRGVDISKDGLVVIADTTNHCTSCSTILDIRVAV